MLADGLLEGRSHPQAMRRRQTVGDQRRLQGHDRAARRDCGGDRAGNLQANGGHRVVCPRLAIATSGNQVLSRCRAASGVARARPRLPQSSIAKLAATTP
jgi:hypothetical protein